MLPTPITEHIPIREDEHGRLRVGGTKVLLDLVIRSFLSGHTPETIVDQYSTLSLDDVYLAIGYYLRHRETIDQYMQTQQELADALQHEDEIRNPPKITRELLLARLKARDKDSKED